ncbi:MAG TPA: Tex-like N-terminal domain-containing protein, partial [Acidobacteriota bacterium]|nr:Tex-like N-terminal domain-containing protein [Acidobacteriota bacterium]
MDAAIISRIAHEVSLPEASVAAVVDLFEKGATAPFIAHYRKEVTNGLDDTRIRAIHQRYAYYREVLDRRVSLLKLVADQGKLTEDLRARIQSCFTKVELEDLYHQFRPKKRTRAAEAIERGLEPLAEYLWNQEPDAWSLQEHIDVFVDPAKKVATREQALQGATEIIAQWIAENIDFRKSLRELLWSEGCVVSTVVPAKAEQKTKYVMYYDRREPVTTIPSHRVLAIRRGSKEGILTSSIEGNHGKAIEYLLSQVIRDKESVFAPILEVGVRESYNRVLRALIETEVRA